MAPDRSLTPLADAWSEASIGRGPAGPVVPARNPPGHGASGMGTPAVSARGQWEISAREPKPRDRSFQERVPRALRCAARTPAQNKRRLIEDWQWHTAALHISLFSRYCVAQEKTIRSRFVQRRGSLSLQLERRAVDLGGAPNLFRDKLRVVSSEDHHAACTSE